MDKCKKLFRMFLVSILMLLFTFTVNAQEQTITGKVYDVAGEPIIGANVLIQGTTQGVITDMEGAFRLKADPSQSLVISFLGYKDMILSIGTKTNFKIVLEEDSEKLDEVVVVGYATQKEGQSDGVCLFCVSQRYSGYSGGQYHHFVAGALARIGIDSKRCTSW